ncbi:MAG: DUF3574 domain-containing protein [Acidobacteriota bacterium]
MRTLIPVILLFAATLMTVPRPTGGAPAPASPCGPQGRPYTRTTLYFGLTAGQAAITESDWKSFLSDAVTPKFPEGLTVWEAKGQWRRPDGKITRERAKVLLLVHEDTPSVRESLSSVIDTYKQAFHQDSVLWETSPVCVGF